MSNGTAPWELAETGEWPVEGRHDASGRLVEGRSKPMTRAEIVREALDKVVHHLTLACTWPRDWTQRMDVVGSYRFYIVEFEPKPGVILYLQVWSEPGDPLLFEVSSGHSHAETEVYLSEDMRESLLGRGFEIAGPAKNFRKKVVVDGKVGVRALAREFLAIVIDALRYDGTSTLKFRLHQDTRSDTARVFRAIQPDDFRRLLERWGIAAQFAPTDENVPIIHAKNAGVSFAVHFHVPRRPPFSRFEMVTLGTSVDVSKGQASAIADAWNAQSMLGRAVATSPSEITLSSSIVAGGGVEPDNLRRQVLGWLGEVRRLAKAKPKST